MKPDRERSERREAGKPPPPPEPPRTSKKTIGGSGWSGEMSVPDGKTAEWVVDTVFAPGNTVTVTSDPATRPRDRHTAHISEVEAKIAQDHLNAAIKAIYANLGPSPVLVAVRAAMSVLKMTEDQ